MCFHFAKVYYKQWLYLDTINMQIQLLVLVVGYMYVTVILLLSKRSCSTVDVTL